MVNFTLNQAAKETGRSKSTIHNAIKDGKLSAHRRDDGVFEIDASELHRVFPQNTKVVETGTDTERLLLQQKIEFLERELTIKDDFVRELSRRLDSESEERKRLTLLLTHEQEQPKTVVKKDNLLWKKLFGKR
jgi:hypothetical protein